MQVLTSVHNDKYKAFGGNLAAFDPITNLRVGVQVLKENIQRAGSVDEGLKHYVGAANLPDDGGYAQRVLAMHEQMKAVAAGRKPIDKPLRESLPTKSAPPEIEARVTDERVALAR
jgi:hypothetical protein